MESDEVAAHEAAMLRKGRQFKMRLRKSCEARQRALATVRQVGTRWVAQVGGPVRGTMIDKGSREAVERAIHDHYNDAMLAYVRGGL